MRIAFCGKGGSGKSTLASLTARMLADKNMSVMVVDGDINQHLGEALGFSEAELLELPKLGMEPDVLLNTVKGTNEHILSVDHITESTPAGRGSGFIHFDQPSDVFDKYQIEKNGIKFMAVGSHTEEETGTTCFHKFTGAFGILLNHLIDRDEDILIGDMCAGADPFASSGLASRFDAIFLVAEPTLKSTGVYDQCKKYADPYGVKIYVIGNKIESQEDEAFIRERVGDDLIACFGKSEYVRNLEKGIMKPISDLEPENKAVLEKILEVSSTLERDWHKFHEIGIKFHKQAAECWGNDLLGTDLMKQVDPEFSYESYLGLSQKKAA